MKVLVADDEAGIRVVLRKFIESLGHVVVESSNGKDAFEKLQSLDIDMAFIDIKMPGISGMEILKRVKDVPIVILTAYSTMDYTINAMKMGALDYITKPFDLDDIKSVIEKVERKTKLMEVDSQEQLMIGSSKKMQGVFKLIGRVARTNATVIVCGESGTGKELVARTIHEYSGRKGDFVPVNCAAIPESLLESELFGYEKGAFTGAISAKKGYFEQAEGGTLFLDEVAELGINLQSKLLRVLQDKEIRRLGGEKVIKVNCRIIAATNRDLEEEVKRGSFREDLYYRLNVFRIFVPPLRERKEDIPELVDFFVRKFSKEFKLPLKKLTRRALDYLLSYDFPGNVRELENIILRAMLVSPVGVIDVDDLFLRLSNELPDLEKVIEEFVMMSLSIDQKERNNLYDMVVRAAEKAVIKKVLSITGWNRTRAADILGIHRNTLRFKIKELNIEKG